MSSDSSGCGLQNSSYVHTNSKKEIQDFLRTMGFWRMHISENRQILSLIYLMKQKRNYFKWGPKKQQSFEQMKQETAHAVALGPVRTRCDGRCPTPEQRIRSFLEILTKSIQGDLRTATGVLEFGIQRIWGLLNLNWKRVLITLWRNLSCFRSDWHESKGSPATLTCQGKVPYTYYAIMPCGESGSLWSHMELK